ncbi:hypothetical protein [Fulvimarina sp. MAC8]
MPEEIPGIASEFGARRPGSSFGLAGKWTVNRQGGLVAQIFGT